jgi:hypothetical protein
MRHNLTSPLVRCLLFLIQEIRLTILYVKLSTHANVIRVEPTVEFDGNGDEKGDSKKLFLRILYSLPNI